MSASLGAPWDKLVTLFRLLPPALGAFSALLLGELLLTVPTQLGVSLARPWRPMGLGLSVMQASPSRFLLEELRATGVPVAVVHGDRDRVVPIAAARDAARRTGGELVVVAGGTHSWVIDEVADVHVQLRELLAGSLRPAYEQALSAAGLDPASASVDAVEAAFYEPGASRLTHA